MFWYSNVPTARAQQQPVQAAPGINTHWYYPAQPTQPVQAAPTSPYTYYYHPSSHQTHTSVQAPQQPAQPAQPQQPALAPAGGVYYYHPAISQPAKAALGTAENPYPWYGNTTHEVDRQNIVMAQNAGATNPTQLIPYQATDAQMWWCREVDGSYTLRNTKTIQDSLQPGYWAMAPNGGYPYFIRQGSS
ncbi:MAG: hypothetical protein M1833_001113 [Piccolia ochrophora]|nr:MAG: hypothetical protein M1833_001113 [Piccolia ochrophora]